MYIQIYVFRILNFDLEKCLTVIFHKFRFKLICVDLRNITNFRVHLLFWLLGSLKTRRLEKAYSMFTLFTNPLLCLKQDDFKITLKDERNGSKDYMKVSLVYKIACCFEILAIIQGQPIFCY